MSEVEHDKDDDLVEENNMLEMSDEDIMKAGPPVDSAAAEEPSGTAVETPPAEAVVSDTDTTSVEVSTRLFGMINFDPL